MRAILPTLAIQGLKMASGNDMKMHEGTYNGFIGLVKWGTVISALVTVFVVYMIV